MLSISLIIPTYNNIETLEFILPFVAKQSYLPYEIIFTDDGSHQDIIALLKKMRKLFSCKILFIQQEDKGFRAAKCRNNAISKATGDYLVFNDQDIIMAEDYLATFRHFADKKEFLVAWHTKLSKEQTDFLYKNPTNDYQTVRNCLQKKQLKKAKSQYSKEKLYYFEKKIFKTKAYHPKLRSGIFGVHRESLLKVNGFDEQYTGWGYEDDDLGRRLNAFGLIGRNVFQDNNPIHLYHPSNNNNTDRLNQDLYQKRKIEIFAGDYFARIGYSNSEDSESVEVIEL